MPSNLIICIAKLFYIARIHFHWRYFSVCTRYMQMARHPWVNIHEFVYAKKYVRTYVNIAVFQRGKKYIITGARIPTVDQNFNEILVSGFMAACLRSGHGTSFSSPSHPAIPLLHSLSLSLSSTHFPFYRWFTQRQNRQPLRKARLDRSMDSHSNMTNTVHHIKMDIKNWAIPYKGKAEKSESHW